MNPKGWAMSAPAHTAEMLEDILDAGIYGQSTSHSGALVLRTAEEGQTRPSVIRAAFPPTARWILRKRTDAQSAAVPIEISYFNGRVVLDESTSALDEETERRMLQNLMGSGMVRTCILVTHRPGSKRLCSRSYYICQGQIYEKKDGETEWSRERRKLIRRSCWINTEYCWKR